MKLEKKFSAELEELRFQIEGHARDYGLDFFPVIFEILDYRKLNEVAAQSGFPNRYPHWKFGMDYEQLSKGYSYGLQKIYELVINNNPCYAYLLESNEIVDQKLVMAHVFGHCDFFKNNFWFSKTNRKMMDEMANYGSRVRRYIDFHGEDTVEEFIDVCLSIEDLIDPYSPFIKREEDKKNPFLKKTNEDEENVKLLDSKGGYMGDYLNPPEFVRRQREKIKEKKEEKKRKEIELIKVNEGDRDILKFLVEYSPLEDWQRDILSIIRNESYYFAPQKQTKIMNEGWASYWHSKIMTEKALIDSELTEYSKHHAGTMGRQPGIINPYKLGLELFLDIEDRWNKGKFGEEYENCKDAVQRKNWDKKLGLGRDKIFEVRRVYNDCGFIDAFLTEDFCRENDFFVYSYDKKNRQYAISNRDFIDIKKNFIFSLTNFGKPAISLKDANHDNKGELLLIHEHPKRNLRKDYADDTLKNLFKIWKKPVNLETTNSENEKIIINCSQDGVSIKNIT